MYTTFNKAIVALVMGIIGVIGVLWHPLGLSAETVASIVAIATPFLVYLVPNLPKDA